MEPTLTLLLWPEFTVSRTQLFQAIGAIGYKFPGACYEILTPHLFCEDFGLAPQSSSPAELMPKYVSWYGMMHFHDLLFLLQFSHLSCLPLWYPSPPRTEVVQYFPWSQGPVIFFIWLYEAQHTLALSYFFFSAVLQVSSDENTSRHICHWYFQGAKPDPGVVPSCIPHLQIEEQPQQELSETSLPSRPVSWPTELCMVHI